MNRVNCLNISKKVVLSNEIVMEDFPPIFLHQLNLFTKSRKKTARKKSNMANDNMENMTLLVVMK